MNFRVSGYFNILIYICDQFQVSGIFREEWTAWTLQRHFFSRFRFQLIKQRTIFLLVNTRACLTRWLTPAGGRGRAGSAPRVKENTAPVSLGGGGGIPEGSALQVAVYP